MFNKNKAKKWEKAKKKGDGTKTQHDRANTISGVNTANLGTNNLLKQNAEGFSNVFW